MTEPMEPLLDARGLSRYFGRGEELVRAVDGVSLIIGAGEVVALVGESGSGKSTLARLLLRLLPPTSGQILMNGTDIVRWRRRAQLRRYWQDVQAVFQDPFSSFNQFFSVGFTLQKALGIIDPRPAGDEAKERMRLALSDVGLDAEEISGKWPHQLSGGQRQRVMVARALMLRPRLLIADEPTSMLDASMRANVLNLLRDIRERHGMAVLFITHDIGQAYYLSDRMLVMYQGNLVEQGPAEELLAAPQHEYTRRLLADVPKLHERIAL